ncbi:hypothetical protein N9235_04105 [Gammaproteobacteria bacterium]|nr:hypothetical protein [Gammaproteobacteria bacterium]
MRGYILAGELHQILLKLLPFAIAQLLGDNGARGAQHAGLAAAAVPRQHIPVRTKPKTDSK